VGWHCNEHLVILSLRHAWGLDVRHLNPSRQCLDLRSLWKDGTLLYVAACRQNLLLRNSLKTHWLEDLASLNYLSSHRNLSQAVGLPLCTRHQLYHSLVLRVKSMLRTSHVLVDDCGSLAWCQLRLLDYLAWLQELCLR